MYETQQPFIYANVTNEKLRQSMKPVLNLRNTGTTKEKVMFAIFELSQYCKFGNFGKLLTEIWYRSGS